MIDPSPDWFVGVSRLELCLDNGSWVESKVLDLFPWDAGTDSGPTYIVRFCAFLTFKLLLSSLIYNYLFLVPRSTNQSAGQYPAYSAGSSSRQSVSLLRWIGIIYETVGSALFVAAEIVRKDMFAGKWYFCASSNVLWLFKHYFIERGSNEGGDGGGGGFEGNVCATSKWSRWSKCDAECGSGSQYRQRHFKNPSLAEDCRTELTEQKSCMSQQQCNNAQSGMWSLTILTFLLLYLCS